MNEQAPLHIVSLEAENVKRLVAVRVEPDPSGGLVVVSGRNGQGKTSVLDSIWLALGGAPAGKASSRVVRDGEDSARVVVDLGDLVVTRKWQRSEDGQERSSLVVESRDGARYRSPQALLDSLVGRLSFDPLAFAHKPAKDQRADLLSLVSLPFDLDTFDRERAEAFAERTELGRAVRAAEARLAAMPVPPPDLPDEEQSSADVLAAMRADEAITSRHRSDVLTVQEAVAQVEQSRQDLAAAERSLVRAEAWLAEARQVLDASPAPTEPVDYMAQLAALEETNRAVRAAHERSAVADELDQRRHDHASTATDTRSCSAPDACLSGTPW